MKEKNYPAELESTQMHLLKPSLTWVGTVLGLDVYADVSSQRQPEEKRQLVQDILVKWCEDGQQPKLSKQKMKDVFEDIAINNIGNDADLQRTLNAIEKL